MAHPGRRDGGEITFNGTSVPVPTVWSDTQITFPLPTGDEWRPGTNVQIGVIAGGLPSQIQPAPLHHPQ